LDDRSQLRVAIEAEAMLGMLGKCEAGEWSLVSSEVLWLEVSRTQQADRKAIVSAILSTAESVIPINDNIERRAKVFETRGFKAFDALHLATAEASQANYFCTCDDRLLNRAMEQQDLMVRVVSPLELANQVNP
jgi:predicted nucleic acid-binding protein